MKRKKKLSRSERQKRKEIRAKQESAELVESTAEAFICTHETARDFAYQCTDQIVDLEADILYNKIAIEIWEQQQIPNVVPLLATLKDLLTERELYQKKLLELEIQLIRIVELDQHEHLEPIEPYLQLVQQRLESLSSH